LRRGPEWDGEVFSANRIIEARFLRPEAATARYGGGYSGGVIELILRREKE